MRKIILIALLVCSKQVNAQSDVKNVTNPKYFKATTTNRQRVIAEDNISAKSNTYRMVLPKTTSSSCPSMHLTSSWNANGVGAGEDCIQQNCLAYNKDLNALVWTQRGSQDWPLFLTSGGIQATFITNAVPSPTHTFATNVLDSVIVFSDSANYIGARYPGGSWLNPAGNTNYHNAYTCATGPYIGGSVFMGSVYNAKPLWGTSAINHTQPTFDSLYCSYLSGFMGPMAGSSSYIGAPNCDGQQVGNTVWSTGSYLDLSVPASSTIPFQQKRKGFILKGTMGSMGVVSWSIDSNSLSPNLYKGSCGYLNATNPRLAFAPDGLHGYAVFIGRLATTFNNTADSAMTPILYKTTDGGNTWIQVLAGYDWANLHPEVKKNLGKGSVSYTGTNTNIYSFDCGYTGVDLTVDANNVLHYVSSVVEAYHGLSGYSYSFDSLNCGGYTYNYDNINYHPIIWDFMTDGTTWNTMMVDSLQSGQCNGTSADSTSNYSSWTSTSPNFLAIGAHLTVSRTPDGTKIFYGWADTPAGITGLVNNAGDTINPNTNPDIFVVGYDVTDTMLTAAINITNLGYCFFPYIADMSYYDSTQSAWVVPAVYTVGRDSLPDTEYNGNSTVDYYYTNCGSLTASDFRLPGKINLAAHHAATGINQQGSNNNLVTVYPNPTNGSFVIDPSSAAKQSMQVYDVNGKLVLSQTISGKTTIDAGKLNEGVYNISLQSNEGVVNKRLVIVR